MTLFDLHHHCQITGPSQDTIRLISDFFLFQAHIDNKKTSNSLHLHLGCSGDWLLYKTNQMLFGNLAEKIHHHNTSDQALPWRANNLEDGLVQSILQLLTDWLQHRTRFRKKMPIEYKACSLPLSAASLYHFKAFA